MKSNKDYDYSIEDVIDSLRSVGISRGDNIFIHSNIGFFGKLKDAVSKEDYYRLFKTAIFEVIGENGTLVVPTFSYSFCWQNVFEREKTPSVCGFLSEAVRKDPQSLRSDDANFSVASIGRNAEHFTKDAPEHSFGVDSFWERFLKSDGKICNFNFDSASTFIHYVEKVLNVHYRYDKPFPGISIENGNERKRVFYHFVYDLDKPSDAPEFTKFDRKAKQLHLAKTANLGKGQIVFISVKDTFSLIEEEIKKDAAFLTRSFV
jgi:aminoglycoside 3-N-acetyltransferase